MRRMTKEEKEYLNNMSEEYQEYPECRSDDYSVYGYEEGIL